MLRISMIGLVAFCVIAWSSAPFVGNVHAQAQTGNKQAGGGGQKGGGKGGQKAGQKGGQGKDKENLLQLSGTVQQVSPQALVVEADGGDRYLIGGGPESKVTLEGDASEEFLKPGAVVEFEMDFDRSGNPIRTIDKLTFVEVSTLNPVGLFPRTVPELAGAADEKGQSSFLVRGRASSLRNGTLVIQTGGRPLLAKLGEDVTYMARFERWALASVGDSVSGTVELLPQPNVGLTRVLANQITVQASGMIEPPNAKRAESKSKGEAKQTSESTQSSSDSQQSSSESKQSASAPN